MLRTHKSIADVQTEKSCRYPVEGLPKLYFRNSLSDLDLFGPESTFFFQRVRIHKHYRIRIVEGQKIIFTLISDPEPQPDPQTA
jgi:hypothetical protein